MLAAASARTGQELAVAVRQGDGNRAGRRSLAAREGEPKRVIGAFEVSEIVRLSLARGAWSMVYGGLSAIA
jgi:hypothetical protein